MSAPTPADVFGTPADASPSPGRPVDPAALAAQGLDPRTGYPLDPRTGWPGRWFDRQGSAVARRRAAARDGAVAALEDTLRAVRGMFQERHVDLAVEQYRREYDRLDAALQELDDALVDPTGPPLPPPTARP